MCPLLGGAFATAADFRVITSQVRTNRTGSGFGSGFPSEVEITGDCQMSHVLEKVLIVDDEPSIRKLLRMGLGTQGYRIIEASDGKTALKRLSEEPELIILDLGLPDISGQELLQRIRALDKYVSIVVLSGRSDETGKVRRLTSVPTITSPSHSEWANSWRECELRFAIRCKPIVRALSFKPAICQQISCGGL